MSKLKDLKDLVQNVNLTEEQIAELLTIIIDMKKKNENADFCALSKTFTELFDIIIAMDNALPHMLSSEDLERAIKSIINLFST